MNEHHDPNVTSDLSAGQADPVRAADPLGTVDQAPDSGSTGEPGPSTDGATGASQVIRDQPAPRPGDNTPAGLPAVHGYRVLREIARGGMGKVLAAHDLTLDRDVAIKVLLPGANPDRFVRESKITARLPHPGIPPVHALGTLADGSPFLAMKLIAGQTLAEEIKTADRPRLVQVFTQVCQAVGFAHNRGVIHRDLKPANVMVGAFGEVQVMDWGLAKELASPETSDEPRASETPSTLVDSDANQTIDYAGPGESTDDQTQAGQVMGSPAYMAPEQARGEPVDARADVFALGGILCKILTGYAPFVGKTSLEVMKRAAAADLSEAITRLDGCGADAELVGICRRCLSPCPVDRWANGQAVADALTAYVNGVQERLQSAERERAVAVTKAIEERRRRKVLVMAAGLVLLVLVAGVIGTTLGMFEAKRQKGYAVEGWGRAETEQQRAEKNFSTARALVLNMGNQINQLETGQKNPKLVDLARRQALEEARKQFDEFRASEPDDKSVQMQAAALHRYSANISRGLGDYGAAKSAYESSIQITEELTKRFPEESEHQLTLALTLGDLAMLEMLTGKLKEAAATLDKALSFAEMPQSDAHESNVDRTIGVIELDRYLIAYLRGRFDDSARFAGRANERLEKLRQVPIERRNSIDPLFAVMAVHGLAITRRELGQTAEALAAHTEAVSRMKALAGPNANRDELFWVCEARREQARTSAAVPERRVAAAADLVEVIQIAEKLVDDSPQLAFYREKLAETYRLRGELLTRLGQLEAAETELKKSLTVSRELLDRFGTHPSGHLLVRGRTYLALGRVRAAVGKKDEAVAEWKKAATIFGMALKNDPDNYHNLLGKTETERALAPPAK